MKNPSLFQSVVIGLFVGAFVLVLIGDAATLTAFIVAGALCLTFLKLDSFKEFSGAGFSAKLKERVDQLEQDLEPIIEKEIEPENTSSETDSKLNRSRPTEEQLSVLLALSDSKYSYRTSTGLSKSAKLNKVQVSEALVYLMEYGFAKKSQTTNKDLWRATKSGKGLVELARSKCG